MTIASNIAGVTVAFVASMPLGGEVLDPPEVEVPRAIERLRRAVHEVEAGAAVMSPGTGQGEQVDLARDLLVRGKRWFDRGDMLTAANDLEAFLVASPGHLVADRLDAHFRLGAAYEALDRRDRSLDHLLQYLAVMQNAKHNREGELLEVVRRLNDLEIDRAIIRRGREADLLSTLLSLSLPRAEASELRLLAGKTAWLGGRLREAQEWLTRVLADSSDNVTKAKASYILAVVADQRGDRKASRDQMKKLAETSDENLGGVRDLARLALARLSVRERFVEDALTYYASIDEGSTSYRDALFESIYVCIELEKYDLAAERAERFLKVFGYQSQYAFEVESLRAYLDLRARRFDSARSRLEASNRSLGELETWVRSSFQGRERVDEKLLAELWRRSAFQVRDADSTRRGRQLFDRLRIAENQLEDLRATLRQASLGVGRAPLQVVLPSLDTRSQQLSRLAQDILTVGHRLLATERIMFDGALTEPERFKLQAAEARRAEIIQGPDRSRPSEDFWAYWLNLGSLNSDLAKAQGQLWRARSDLSVILALDGPSPPKMRADWSARLKVAERRIGELAETVRLVKTQQRLLGARHRQVETMLVQYVSSLHEELSLLVPQRDRRSSTARTLSGQRFEEAWSLWEVAVRRVFTAVKDLDQRMALSLQSWIDNMDRLMTRQEGLKAELRAERDALELELGRATATTLAHFEAEIVDRRALNEKWLSDIHWLEVDGLDGDLKAVRTGRDLEVEKLRSKTPLRSKGVEERL